MSETALDNLPDCAAVPKSALDPALTAKAAWRLTRGVPGSAEDIREQRVRSFAWLSR
jgi:hypothetical protein